MARGAHKKLLCVTDDPCARARYFALSFVAGSRSRVLYRYGAQLHE
jgi:hypothetical protein